MTPEQLAERQKRAEETKAWRLSVPMAKYKAFRKMYEDAGVKIYAFKLPPTLEMSDEEYAYIWNVAETLGANHITMELPTDDALLKRVADYAAKRKLRIAFHTHGQGGASGFDKVLAASPYTALNFDVGHYYGVNGESPVPLVEKYHDRIASLHLKDRKGPTPGQPAAEGGRGGGPNMPWGQGETPLEASPAAHEAEQVQVPGQHRVRVPDAGGLRRADRDEEVRGVLQEGAGVAGRNIVKTTPNRFILCVCTLAVTLALLAPAPLLSQAAAGGGQKLVPVPIVLPQPVFEGTPRNLKVPNLEKPRWKAREPFLAPEGVKNVAQAQDGHRQRG